MKMLRSESYGRLTVLPLSFILATAVCIGLTQVNAQPDTANLTEPYNRNVAACAYLSQQFSQPLIPVPYASVPPGYCASIYVVDSGLTTRGLLSLPFNKGLLSVERDSNRVRWYSDLDGSGSINQTFGSPEQASILDLTGMNSGAHGIDVWLNQTTGGQGQWMLITSSETTVYAWPYDFINNPSKVITGPPTILVIGMPTGFHKTRTVRVDRGKNLLYVSVGSGMNLDASTVRSAIFRYNLLAVPKGGWGYLQGAYQAYGVRNAVGIQFDSYGVLWGVENGADQLSRSDLGGDIHGDNPGEEVHKYDKGDAAFYGYPNCWSEYSLNSSITKQQGRGGQWQWPNTPVGKDQPVAFSNTFNDATCLNPSQNVRPSAVMQAHSAPLGLIFYPPGFYTNVTFNTTLPTPSSILRSPTALKYAFPPAPTGSYLYITQHGSTDPGVSVRKGYRVVRFATKDLGTTGGGIQIVGEALPFYIFNHSDSVATSSSWQCRPVDLAIGPQGELFISDDLFGQIIAVRYVGYVPPVSSTGGMGGDGSSTGQAASTGPSDAQSSTGDGNSGPTGATGSSGSPTGQQLASTGTDGFQAANTLQGLQPILAIILLLLALWTTKLL